MAAPGLDLQPSEGGDSISLHHSPPRAPAAEVIRNSTQLVLDAKRVSE